MLNFCHWEFKYFPNELKQDSYFPKRGEFGSAFAYLFFHSCKKSEWIGSQTFYVFDRNVSI